MRGDKERGDKERGDRERGDIETKGLRDGDFRRDGETEIGTRNQEPEPSEASSALPDCVSRQGR